MPITSLPEGTSALMNKLPFNEVMRLIEQTAKWVAPETFKLLPVWYPEHARQRLLYKKNWSEPQMNTKRQTGLSAHKYEGNVHANKALTSALGLRPDGRKGWSCCHLWGIDDQTYQHPNVVVQDPRFFSCIANMVLLPAPLKAFTDSVPEVKAMLRICARNTYKWQCNHKEMKSINTTLDSWGEWTNYPKSWPREPGASIPMGTMPISSDIQKRADKRWCTIQSDMEEAGAYFPRDSIRTVLAYWEMDLTAPLKSA